MRFRSERFLLHHPRFFLLRPGGLEFWGGRRPIEQYDGSLRFEFLLQRGQQFFLFMFFLLLLSRFFFLRLGQHFRELLFCVRRGWVLKFLGFAFFARPLTSPSNQDRSADCPVCKETGRAEKEGADNEKRKQASWWMHHSRIPSPLGSLQFK